MTTDHYGVLGVCPDADRAAIRAAYLRTMRDHHPDRRPGDPVSADAARRANAAWEVLSDGARRTAYDRLRTARCGGHSAGGGGRGSVHDQLLSRESDTAVTWAGVSSRIGQAYSPDHHRVRRDIHLACVRAGAAVVATGAALLLAVG